MAIDQNIDKEVLDKFNPTSCSMVIGFVMDIEVICCGAMDKDSC